MPVWSFEKPKKRKKRKQMKKKPTKLSMIGIHSKYITGSGLYEVNWGLGGKDGYSGYNSRHKGFTTRKQATRFKNILIRKLKSEGYKTDYMYIAD